jgi:hypothetical protein
MFYYSEDILYVMRHAPNFSKPGYLERYLTQVVSSIQTFPHLLKDYPQYRYDFIEQIYFLKQQSSFVNAAFFSDLLEINIPHYILWGAFLLLIKHNLHHEEKKICIALIEQHRDKFFQDGLVMMVHDKFSGIANSFNHNSQHLADMVSQTLYLMPDMNIPLRLAPTAKEMEQLKSLVFQRQTMVKQIYQQQGADKAHELLLAFNHQYSHITHLPEYTQWLNIIGYQKPLFIYT